MRWNPKTFRYEVVDVNGEVVAWISAEVPDKDRWYWYEEVVLKRVYGLR